MFLNVGNKRFGWLAALVFWPVAGLGQEPMIIRHPQDVIACSDEIAEFSVIVKGGHLDWSINGSAIINYPENSDFMINNQAVEGGFLSTLSIPKLSEQITGFNNSIIHAENVQNLVLILSENATLIYKTNPQSPVTGLPPTINDMAARFDWDEPDTNQTTRFFFGVYDANNNQITNQTTNANHISYDFSPTCQQLEFRITAIEVQYPECPDIEQTRYTAYFHTKPNIAPVTAELDNNRTVQINWTPNGSGAYLVSVTDMDRSEGIKATQDNPPFGYRLTGCGQYTLNVSVSPVECAGDPAWVIYYANIGFTIPCPTTPTTVTSTEPEAEITDEHSGTQTISPSLLLAVAAVIPLLKWQH